MKGLRSKLSWKGMLTQGSFTLLPMANTVSSRFIDLKMTMVLLLVLTVLKATLRIIIKSVRDPRTDGYRLAGGSDS
jgi:hypothetical protein